MRRFVVIALVTTLSFSTTPLFSAPRIAKAHDGASLSGNASNPSGQTLANVAVQLRNVATGQLAGSTTASATGSFSFEGLQAGQYAVEVVDAAGSIVGTSAAITVAAGATVTDVTVTTTAAVAAGAAGGTAAAGAAASGAAAGGGMSTAMLVTTIAAAAGVTGAVAVAHNASPSR